MKAVVVTRSGGPEVLEVRDVPEPQPAPGEVVVRVEAVGINFADTMTTRGTYSGTPPPPFITGREFAGVVEGTGERVMGYVQWGAAAEKIADQARARCGRSPKDGPRYSRRRFPVNFPDGLSGVLEGRHDGRRDGADSLDREHQRRVLIHAAAGGVGTAAVQIGKLLAIETYGTSSSNEKLERVKKLGLDHGSIIARWITSSA